MNIGDHFHKNVFLQALLCDGAVFSTAFVMQTSLEIACLLCSFQTFGICFVQDSSCQLNLVGSVFIQISKIFRSESRDIFIILHSYFFFMFTFVFPLQISTVHFKLKPRQHLLFQSIPVKLHRPRRRRSWNHEYKRSSNKVCQIRFQFNLYFSFIRPTTGTGV